MRAMTAGSNSPRAATRSRVASPRARSTGRASGASTARASRWAAMVAAGLEHVIPEMEFWLPARDVKARELDRLCRATTLDGAPRPMLADREVHGMLMGYADLVFEHEGRFWVLDYKSNHLGDSDDDYSRARLAASMAEHRYDMQAAIYLAALHRLLRSRLGAQYDPERHLGGAIYLYLRGIDGPERGVYLVEPVRPLLDGVDAMLGPDGSQP